ncbi:MAG: penicillin-binding protein activator LpoB [Oligoflexales bacterium]|nr:penicillin-binding protein activator LpoB [Oligoflexales bacterium]
MFRKLCVLSYLLRVSAGVLLMTFIMILTGCATGGGVYESSEKEKILDDKWNNTDANKVANYMIDKCLSAPWLKEFEKKNKGKKPVVIVMKMKNRTDEHIDTDALTEAIRSELINSGKVRFLAAEKRDEILKELEYQNSGAVSKESKKDRGKQIGADYVISGAISSIVNQKGDLKDVTYRVDMNISNIETSEIEWNGYQKISKAFKR